MAALCGYSWCLSLGLQKWAVLIGGLVLFSSWGAFIIAEVMAEARYPMGTNQDASDTLRGWASRIHAGEPTRHHAAGITRPYCKVGKEELSWVSYSPEMRMCLAYSRRMRSMMA